MQVFCVLVIDKEVVFSGRAGVVGAGAVGLVVGGEGLGAACDGREKAGAVDFYEAEWS